MWLRWIVRIACNKYDMCTFPQRAHTNIIYTIGFTKLIKSMLYELETEPRVLNYQNS